MKTINFLTIALAAILLAGFSSCSDLKDTDSDNGNNGVGQKAEAYIALKITIPNDAAASRAETAEDSGVYEAGTSDEYDIKSLYLHFYDDATGDLATDVGALGVVTIPSSKLYPTGPTSDIVYNISQPVPITLTSVPKTYKVIAVANYDFVDPAAAIEGTLQAAAFGNSTAAGTGASKYAAGLISAIPDGTSPNPFENGLLMASRTATSETSNPYYYKSSPYSTITIDVTNTQTKPAPLSIEMERGVAKLAIAGGGSSNDNVYTLNSGTDAECEIEIVEYAAINLKTDSYIYRLVSDGTNKGYGNLAAPTDAGYGFKYLYSTGFGDKVAVGTIAPYSLVNSVVENIVASTGNVVDYSTLGSKGAMPAGATYSKIGYCLENSAKEEFQINAYSTGMLFKGEITPLVVYEDDGSGFDVVVMASIPTDFFYHNGRFYEDIAAIAADPASAAAVKGLNNTTPSATPADQKLLHNLGIEKYVGGVCYYTYWIKHLDSPSVENDVMEFAVVRNNVYNMRITSISNLGPGQPYIDPEDPNELAATYFKVDLAIRPWIVRTNDIQF